MWKFENLKMWEMWRCENLQMNFEIDELVTEYIEPQN